MTMAYAKNKGIWPRTAPKPPPPGRDPPPGPDPPPPPPPPPPPVGEFSTEGVLKDALVQLWEQARAKRVVMIGTLKIRMFDAGDAFRLPGAVGAVSGAQKVVAITGGCETPDGGTFELEFRGSVPDAEPVKEFLEQQLRGAKSTRVEATFELSFAEGCRWKEIRPRCSRISAAMTVHERHPVGPDFADGHRLQPRQRGRDIRPLEVVPCGRKVVDRGRQRAAGRPEAGGEQVEAAHRPSRRRRRRSPPRAGITKRSDMRKS